MIGAQRSLVALGGLIAASVAALSGVRAAAPQVFHSGVELIVVDVSVVDRNGQPTSTLRPEQFEVTLDGMPRRVVSADFIDLRPEPGPSQPTSGSTAALHAFYSSNATQGSTARSGRLVILAIDQSSFRPAGAMAAIESTRKFLDRLQPGDRVGLVAFPLPGPSVAPTTDRAAVRAALGKVIGTAVPASSLAGPTRFNISVSEALAIADRQSFDFQAVVNRECALVRTSQDLQYCRDQIQMTADSMALAIEAQSQRSLQGIDDVVEAVGSLREHKSLVVLSAGLISSERATGRASFGGQMAQIGRVASATNTNIYVLHFDNAFLEAFSAESKSMSQTLFQDISLAATGLETISGSAGGTLFRVATGPEFAFDRVLKETSAYYLLGVEPAEGDRDGKSHRLGVAVKLPGVSVRSRREVILPRASAGPRSPERTVVDALEDPRVASTLPIRMTTTTTARLSAEACEVLLSADIGDALPATLEMRVGYVVTDAAGHRSEPVVVARRLAHRASGPQGSVSYIAALVMRPGTYTARLATADPAGLVGSADHRFTVRMEESGGMTLGEILLADSARGPDDAIAPVSDGRVQAKAVTTYVEVIPPPGGAVSGVNFGVADSPDGPPLVSRAGRMIPKAKSRAIAAEARLDLAMLPPGDYFAVAIVADRAKRSVRVSRPFTINRPAPPEGDAAGPHAPVAFNAAGALLRPFTRDDVLRPDVLEFFIGRMKALDPRPPSQALGRAIEQAQQGRFDAVLSELATESPDQLSVFFLRGLALFSKGELNGAAREMRAAIRTSSEFLPAAFYVGACFAAGGQDEQAVGAWQTALITENEVRMIYEVIADAQLRLGESAGALDILTEARGHWPDDDGLLPRVGVALAAAGKWDAALKTLIEFIDRHPESADVEFLAARLLYDVHAEGKVVISAAEDRDLITRVAALYKEAGGPNAALVARWAQFVQQNASKR